MAGVLPTQWHILGKMCGFCTASSTLPSVLLLYRCILVAFHCRQPSQALLWHTYPDHPKYALGLVVLCWLYLQGQSLAEQIGEQLEALDVAGASFRRQMHSASKKHIAMQKERAANLAILQHGVDMSSTSQVQASLDAAVVAMMTGQPMESKYATLPAGESQFFYTEELVNAFMSAPGVSHHGCNTHHNAKHMQTAVQAANWCCLRNTHDNQGSDSQH